MFAPSTRQSVDPRTLKALGERVRPIAEARARRLPVTASFRDLLPGGLRRGTTVGVTADEAGGGTTLALSLVAAASQAGSWCAVVGIPDLGAPAAEQLGVDLNRLVCVPCPGVQWAPAIADLIEGVDVVILRPPPHVKGALVGRLVARLRDRRAVLVVVDEGGRWPESYDVHLRVETARWVSIGPGEDCLRRRLATVSAGDGVRGAGAAPSSSGSRPARPG